MSEKAVHLFNSELDKLIEHHNRVPDDYPYGDFPYDQKPTIVAWLRDHGLTNLADSVATCDPPFIASFIAGYRAGYKREEAFVKAFMG